MSGLSIDLSSAISLVEGSSCSTTYINFHAVFGTSGCLLYCHHRSTNQQLYSLVPHGSKSKRRIGRAEQKNLYDTARTEWLNRYFTPDELSASISNGCGSCKLFKLILNAVFPESGLDESKETLSRYVYSVSPSFAFSQRNAIDDTKEIGKIQLFHPRGNPDNPSIFKRISDTR
jgi:hypothetical protein